ncbi:hypothetical protein AX17_005018 [Amanita inopinata Kibby_2008]|nr:hypothetical protein AX17_005018 [Amanita inopinata Kibby_2008]
MSKKDGIPRFIGNWSLQDNLGSGYSGSIFRARHIHTGQIVALKVQNVDHECPTNQYERYLYPLLQGGKGMPTFWGSGVSGKWDYMAIDLLGASLDRLYRSSGKEKMDLRSVCCIAMQLISRLEFMHSRGVLHRDIQLGNCAIGLPPHDKMIYMIDFGFGKRYLDPRTHRHIPDSKVKRDFIGNYWFSSVGVHCRGKVPSRRDDLEALALMLIHLLTPRGLSWTRNGVPKTDDAHERLKREKRNARPEDLCRGLPPEFEEFLRYCRHLNFYDKPDYAKWVGEFGSLAVESGFPDTDDFIWPPPLPPAAKPRPLAERSEDIKGVLIDLKNLVLSMPVQDGTKRADQVGGKDDKEETDSKATGTETVIEVSSGSDLDEPVVVKRMIPKRLRLMRLTKKVDTAADNLALSKLVHDFIEDLQCNSSRILTKEGFDFIDALYKQLADPSVFIVPLRTSQSRSNNGSAEGKESWIAKLDIVARLRREVRGASSNRTLADMVAEFGRVTNRSSGRTVTKDGFGFLEGLSKRLEDLHS